MFDNSIWLSPSYVCCRFTDYDNRYATDPQHVYDKYLITRISDVIQVI